MGRLFQTRELAAPQQRMQDARCYSACTYCFVDDVTCSYNGLYGGMSLLLQRRRCSVVRRLKPLLLGTGCVVSWTTAGIKTRRALRTRGTGSGVCCCCYRTSYACAVLAVVVCLSVRLSVTSRYCIKTAKCRITQTAPHDSPGTLVFWLQRPLCNSNEVTPNEGAKCR